MNNIVNIDGISLNAKEIVSVEWHPIYKQTQIKLKNHDEHLVDLRSHEVEIMWGQALHNTQEIVIKQPVEVVLTKPKKEVKKDKVATQGLAKFDMGDIFNA